jgi:hypothetical protein
VKLRRVVLSAILVAGAVVAGGTIPPDRAQAASVLRVPGQYPTIKAAIAAAVAGDTVLVAPGTYRGGFGFLAKNITLEGAGNNSTVLDFNQNQGVIMGPRGTLTGFTLVNSKGPAVRTNFWDSVIRNNTFVANFGTGAGGAAIFGEHPVSPIIESNVFWANQCDDGPHGAVVSFLDGYQPLIRNNQFVANECDAIDLAVTGDDAGGVVNNTIVANRTGISMGRSHGQYSQIFRNNLIVGNAVGVDMPVLAGSDPDPVWDHNLLFDNETNYRGLPDQTGTNGNLSVDPKLVDNFAIDYRLEPGSPAIDAGSSANAPLVDFDGMSRPVDGDGNSSALVDIGAFEHAPGALPVVSGPIVSTPEGNSGTHNVTITVKLSKASTSVVSVEYLTIDDTAASTTEANPKGDYLDRFGTFTFQPGQISKSVTVPIQGDQLDEINEEFWVVPYLPVHATLGDYPTIRIIDDDPLPSLTAGTALTVEGDSGGHAMTFPVRLSKPSGRTVTATFSVVGATARPDTDFVKKTGVVTFAPGQTLRPVTVWVKGDVKKEPVLETLTVRFTQPTNAWIPATSARVVGTIVDDD